MEIFSATYTDFIKFDRKPNEDFYLVSTILPIFALADGVTQAHFPSGDYAFPVGARAAAEIFCYSVCQFLEENLRENYSNILKNLRIIEGFIEEGFDLANFRIKKLNETEGITEKLDYWIYDYFDTVGIVGIILKNTLFYGYVGDCGLAVFDEKDNLRFQTRDQVALAFKLARERYPNWERFEDAKKIKIMHKEFRNAPFGEGYGSFTGEEGVKKYYVIDSLSLNPGDLIVFYSDGFASYFQFPEFIKILRQQDKKALDRFVLKKAKENYRKFGTDRTLIAINY